MRDADVVVRATAAEILGDQTPDEANASALITALPRALQDRDLNDAVLAILDALAKQKSAPANEAIKTALDSSDQLIRRRAVALLKANGVGDFSNRIGTVKTRLLKGRGNYVCHHHLERASTQGTFASRADAAYLPRIASFARTSTTVKPMMLAMTAIPFVGPAGLAYP